MKIDILPAKLEVTRDEDNVIQSAVLKIGGPFARPFKYIAWNVALDDLAHLEPEEVKQGEWITNTTIDGYTTHANCSCCGYERRVGRGCSLDLDNLPNFCEKCGARMKGGDEE